MFKKLMFEDINLKTGFVYSVYMCESVIKKSYLIYECDKNGNMKAIKEFISWDEAMSFARRKVKI